VELQAGKVIKRSSTEVSHNPSVRDMRQERDGGEGEGVVPYDIETPHVPTLPSTTGEDHPNVVPFKGVTFNPHQLVSEWMPGGELRDYVKKNRDANPIQLVGLFPPYSAHHLILASVA
jgi:serine/threonine protein kinase